MSEVDSTQSEQLFCKAINHPAHMKGTHAITADDGKLAIEQARATFPSRSLPAVKSQHAEAVIYACMYAVTMSHTP